MERDFYNEDIEQLIKQKADQYKMYPSDKVWKGIHRSIHPRRKWYWFSFVLFLGALSYYTIMDMIALPRNSTVANAKNPATQSPSAQPEKQAVVIPFVTAGKEQSSKGPVAAKTSPTNFVETRNSDNDIVNTPAPTEFLAENNTVSAYRETKVIDFRTGRLKEDLVSAAPANRISRASTTENTIAPNIAEPATEPSAGISLKSVDALEMSEDSKRINWLQQNATYELKAARPQRLSWQLSFSPTMNYRKLAGNQHSRMQGDVKNVPMAVDIEGDPDKLVRHKPALGLEIGSHFIYAIDKTFAVKAGVQFNYSRYDISAYSSNVPELATIALNSTSGSGVIGDSITNYTNLRNFGGDAAQELRNQYFQFSVPIGIEWRLLGNNKLQLGVAGTVQPTYLLNRNTYLITTDYKNYTKEPSLLRKWNLNTSAEAFISYRTGDLKWHVGPQFRYQLFSSYIKEYPITEHLMEFGIKIGVAKTIR